MTPPVHIASNSHLSGHEDRTIYVTGIHACCTKAVLKSAIVDALSAGDLSAPVSNQEEFPSLTPTRIVISQPVWINRIPSKFER